MVTNEGGEKMTTYTVQVTYQLEIDSEILPRDNGFEWIEDNIYQSVEIGLNTKADIVDLVIE